MDWWTPLPPEHGLYTLVTRRWTVDELIKVAVSEDGPFIAHLRKLRDRARGVKSIGDAFEAIQAARRSTTTCYSISSGGRASAGAGSRRGRVPLQALYRVFQQTPALRPTPIASNRFYKVGGALIPGKPSFKSYVKRPADEELFGKLRAGQFCYVLSTRQMAKLA